MGSSKNVDEIKKMASGSAQEIEKIGKMSTREIYQEIALLQGKSSNLSYDENIRLELLIKSANARYANTKKAGNPK